MAAKATRFGLSGLPALQGNTGAIIAMCAAMALFIFNDTLIKIAGAEIPVRQILFIRGIIACVILYALARAFGQLKPLPKDAWMPVSVRLFAEIVCTYLYLSALVNMPLGNATAILQSLPLVLTVFAALVLKETVGWRRWLAVVAGFIGMILIVRPGADGFNIYALYAVGAVFFIVLRDLSTRAIPASVPSLTVSLLSMMAVTVAGAGLTAFEGEWTTPSLYTLVVLAGAAILLNGAFFFIIAAMRTGDISAVSPYRYTILLWALLIGFVFFGEVPDLIAGVGIALITMSGLYVFARERRHREAQAS